MRLGHVHLKVKDLEIAESFYSDILGLKVSERVSNTFSFLSFGKAHHDLALQAIGANAKNSNEDQVGLYHTAFEVNNVEEFKLILNRLNKLNVTNTLVDHGISWAIYFSDPDGNGVEAYLDQRKTSGQEWKGKSFRLSLQDLGLSSNLP